VHQFVIPSLRCISDVPNPQQVAAMKQTTVSRFATAIVNPLAAIYKLRQSSINIFYDQRGGLIAFNRNGSLFLNLRYAMIVPVP
jgi:hypothetical protein